MPGRGSGGWRHSSLVTPPSLRGGRDRGRSFPQVAPAERGLHPWLQPVAPPGPCRSRQRNFFPPRSPSRSLPTAAPPLMDAAPVLWDYRSTLEGDSTGLEDRPEILEDNLNDLEDGSVIPKEEPPVLKHRGAALRHARVVRQRTRRTPRRALRPDWIRLWPQRGRGLSPRPARRRAGVRVATGGRNPWRRSRARTPPRPAPCGEVRGGDDGSAERSYGRKNPRTLHRRRSAQRWRLTCPSRGRRPHTRGRLWRRPSSHRRSSFHTPRRFGRSIWRSTRPSRARVGCCGR